MVLDPKGKQIKMEMDIIIIANHMGVLKSTTMAPF
jgi:hypothetical protein